MKNDVFDPIFSMILQPTIDTPNDGRTFWPRTFWPGRFGQDVLATDVLATYIEKTDVLAKSIIYVLIIDIKATNIFNLQTIFKVW